MIVYNTIEALQKHIIKEKSLDKSIGFVPSMGALHSGHISLINRSKQDCDITIASIFVNPTQFNNPDDLLKYPRTLEADLKLLSEAHCDIVFAPSVDEMYPKNLETIELDLDTLKNVMEDALRPGHFNGVVNVVHRLFDIVKPTKAFFGLKDFQQVAVIKYMTKQFDLPIEIIPCTTIRETSGLAMSSRNLRLSEKEKEDALIIFKTLNFAKELAKVENPKKVKEQALAFFNQGKLKNEYIEIVHPDSLISLDETWVKGATVCIAAFCGDVRLIDNMEIY